MARVVFLGTPEAAVPALDSLTQRHEIPLVVTQPDRAQGRSKRPVPSPVKRLASAKGLTVAQPEDRSELAKQFEDHGPFDVGVVVAYGRILRPEILEAPDRGLLNAHFSLLPRWRGAAPVARALMAGDAMTGVTIMKLDEGLDTGPILTAQAIDIPPGVDAGQLTESLAKVGARLLVETIPSYLDGSSEPVPQSDEGVSYADKLEKHDRPIDTAAEPESVVAQVRGLAPSPAATLDIDGEIHKILAARVADTPVQPGAWVVVDGRPLVGLAAGTIELLRLQPPGRTPQAGGDWANGRRRAGGLVR